jgi:type I restriction enzyme S subunit
MSYWFFRDAALRGRFGEAGRGVNIRHLGKAGLTRFGVPVPPLAEQERIVAAIEEHFSRLDAAKASLQSACIKVELLKQQVLEGSLIGHPVRLGQLLAEPLRNGLSAKRSDDGNIRILTLTAVTKAAFTEYNTKLAKVEQHRAQDLFLHPGDILIQRSNTPELVGTAAIYEGPDQWAIFPDLLVRVRVRPRVDPAYVELALRSRRLRRYFQQAAQGIAGSMPKISQATVERAEISLPSIKRQREIVRVVRDAFDDIGRLHASITFELNRSRALRRSILSAAFSGRLISQDSGDE